MKIFLLPLLTALLFAGCATTSNETPPTTTAAPRLSSKAIAQAERDKVLISYRKAADAMRRGDYATAKTELDDALSSINNRFGKDKDAKRARSYFSEEATKTFVGEPYERVMANYYRAILYWMDGEPDNARACYKTAQYEDSDAEAKAYAADYVLADYLDGLVTTKLGGDGAPLYESARKSSRTTPPPAYDKSANVLFFVEMGQGPGKTAAGQYREQLRFTPGHSPSSSVRINVGSKTLTQPAYDDLTYQATTRGGRVVDYVLKGKASFKGTADSVGDAALVSGAAVAASGQSGEAALGLALFGLASKLVSAATTPAADLRAWDNLPNNLSFGALALPVGQHTAKVEFLTPAGSVATSKDVSVNVTGTDKDTVIFVSDR
jgi:tetratricopeptide (TPR) repeat protein